MIRGFGGLLGVLLVASACVPSAPAAATATPSSQPTSASPTATRLPVASGLATAPHAIVGPVRAWYLVPDVLSKDMVHVTVTFPDGDPSAGTPRVRLRSNGRVVPLERSRDIPASWQAELPLDGVVPGDQRLEVIVRLQSGQDEAVGQRDFKASFPEYVVWTLDFEGDAAPAETMGNTAAIADALKIPMTVMWNPRVWTTSSVTSFSANAMLDWTKGRAAKGDEIGLHIHAWADFVQSAGVTPRTAPNWAGRSDGYDVPLTAFDEEETARLIAQATRLMRDHGLPQPTTFRGGGLFANAANLRAIANAGFSADTSATAAGVFGRLPLPWTLAKDAQPYRPSTTDANAAGDLPLLEVPNIAGNTYGYTSFSIQTTVRDDLAMLAPSGQVAASRRTLTLVSHPGTIDATERAAIETLFRAFAPLRYDTDTGPVRFVTLAQVAAVYSR
ncbi:MAG: hypothetical protein AUH85_09310 [Chloroflexi bacterium 13_1_40CM_4_68_4]|nr:MAG: hypothetical protein AUH85_09310 [Chloroflexi bacterium 13_1_40CM_4_68_4]